MVSPIPRLSSKYRPSNPELDIDVEAVLPGSLCSGLLFDTPDEHAPCVRPVSRLPYDHLSCSSVYEK